MICWNCKKYEMCFKPKAMNHWRICNNCKVEASLFTKWVNNKQVASDSIKTYVVRESDTFIVAYTPKNINNFLIQQYFKNKFFVHNVDEISKDNLLKIGRLLLKTQILK